MKDKFDIFGNVETRKLDLQRFAKQATETATEEVTTEDTEAGQQSTKDFSDEQKSVIGEILKSQINEIEEKHKKELSGLNRSNTDKQKAIEELKKEKAKFEESQMSVDELDKKRKEEFAAMLQEKEAKLSAMELNIQINDYIKDNQVKDMRIDPKLKDYLKAPDLASFITNVEGFYEKVLLPLVETELQKRLKGANPIPGSGVTQTETGLDIYDKDTFDKIKSDGKLIGEDLPKFRRTADYYRTH